MGMFDSVFVECPACGKRLEFQSKSGRCHLDEFTLWNAPTEVVAGTDDVECKKCGRTWKLVLPPVTPIVREVSDHDDDAFRS